MDTELRDWLARLEGRLARLDARIDALEAAAAHAPAASTAQARPAPPAPPPPPPTGDPAADEVTGTVIDPEVLIVISAAVAALLGESALVRQVRLLSSRAWAQQGRVTIQASHRLY